MQRPERASRFSRPASSTLPGRVSALVAPARLLVQSPRSLQLRCLSACSRASTTTFSIAPAHPLLATHTHTSSSYRLFFSDYIALTNMVSITSRYSDSKVVAFLLSFIFLDSRLSICDDDYLLQYSVGDTHEQRVQKDACFPPTHRPFTGRWFGRAL